MNPVDLNVKIVPESGSSKNGSLTNASDGDSFGNLLSQQIDRQSELNSPEPEHDQAGSMDHEKNELYQPDAKKADVLIDVANIQVLQAGSLSPDSQSGLEQSPGAVIESSGKYPESASNYDLKKTLSGSLTQGLDVSDAMPAIPAGNNLSARQFSMQEVIAKSVIGKGTDSIDTPSSSIKQMSSAKSYGTAEKNLESVLSFIQTSINDNGEAKALTSSAQASPATVFSPLSNGIVTSQNMNPVQTTISTPLQHQTWGEQMVQQIKQFTLEKIGVAEIKITPQELGPIRVEIALDNNDAAIHFAAQQQETRDALLHHMNRLKEALSEAGVQLQSATTGSFSNGQAFSFLQQQSRERNSGSNYQSSSGLASLAETSILPPSTANTPIKSGRSGVDLFV